MLKLKTCSTYAHYSKSYIYVNKINFAKTLLLKISKKKKVAFNIANEASYFYILSGQKLILKKCQKWSILTKFWKPDACGQTVLPDRSLLIGQKLLENAKIENEKCDILSDF